MYTAIRTYTTSDTQEVARRVKAEFVPTIKDLPGFIGYYVVDAGEGKIATITVCDEREDVEESTKRAAEWVRDRLSSLITSGPDVFMGDTVVSETAARVTT
jgi:heme-degrading monooxygenase HmoA